MVARSFYERIFRHVFDSRGIPPFGHSSRQDLAEALVISRDIEIPAPCVNARIRCTRRRSSIIPTENLNFRSRGERERRGRERGRGVADSARDRAHPFPCWTPLFSRFLDFLPVWPRLNYRKPCFGCHGRIPISRRVARVAGTPYGVSRILYEFLSWNDSFICLSSIPSPPPAPPSPPPPLPPALRPLFLLCVSRASSISHSSISPFASLAESLSIPICLSFHPTEPQTWRAFCRELDGWISRASKPATELAQSGCEN